MITKKKRHSYQVATGKANSAWEDACVCVSKRADIGFKSRSESTTQLHMEREWEVKL